MERFQLDGYDVAYIDNDKRKSDADPLVFWAHGWGQSHEAYRALMDGFPVPARHIALDFPGFGGSPKPFDTLEDSWGSAEYADMCIAMIEALRDQGQSVVWVGHSFGCRVGTQVAGRQPDWLSAAVFIAGAIKWKRPLLKRLELWAKVRVYKVGKWVRRHLASWGLLKSLEANVGSVDYRAAGDMRGVLVRVVNEDLSEQARAVKCPVLLVYGADDEHTPPAVGQRFHSLIEDSQLVILPDQDHYSLLSDQGRHQVLLRMKSFIGKLDKL